MKSFQTLSDSEMEIMQMIWKSATPVTSSQLPETFAEKSWKIQTMSTFLIRLVDKGVLTVTKEGKSNVYSPAVDEEGYHALEARQVVDSLYHGSLRNFLAAFRGGQPLSQQEAEDLRAWFDEVTDHD